MTKRSVILHGTDGDPSHHWQPWLKAELESSGYSVFLPKLPENHTPNKKVYDDFLRSAGWDFSDNIVIGHSSGATEVLNLLMSDWLPHLKAVVFVGTFLNERLLDGKAWYTPGQFDKLFLPFYDPEVMKSKADAFYFVHGSNDRVCDINDAKKLSDSLGATFITIENGGHLTESSNSFSIPELIEALRRDKLVL